MTETASCISDLDFDRLMVGELGPAAAARVHQHLSGCSRCAGRHQSLVAVAEDLFARRPRLRGEAMLGQQPRPWRRGLWPFGLQLLAASAAATAGLLFAFTRPPSSPEEARLKGGLAIDTFVRRPDGTVDQVLPGGAVSPGDQLRFRLTVPPTTSPTRAAGRHVALISVDPAGTVSSYLPASPRLRALPAGTAVELEGSAELDGTLGPERVVALVCPEPLDTAAVLAAVPGRLDQLAGCAQAWFSFVKVPRAR